jgi:hypothetical protein
MKPENWGEFFLPKWKGVKWTWKRWLFFAFAICAFVDQFFVPFYRGPDPGGSGDGMLFLILGFRVVSRSELPPSVVVAGGCLVGITLALNHGQLKSARLFLLPIVVALLVFVMFWGRRKAEVAPSVL